MRTVLNGLAIAAMLLGGAAAPAQVRTIDPNQAIDSDLGGQRSAPPRTAQADPTNYPYEPVQSGSQSDPMQEVPPAPAQQAPAQPLPPPAARSEVAQEQRAEATTTADQTFKRDDLIGAGEGVFGKGAEGFASIIEKILKDQGQPNAYIAGREASGAFIVGLRYGSGIMTHKVEGQKPVYWTGPSVGFDVGGDANKVFVLVYNLYDTEELYKRFPAAEGRLYFVGGFAATYLRRGNVVLIPVRLGVGWRAGVNVGYMNFTHKSRWLPF